MVLEAVTSDVNESASASGTSDSTSASSAAVRRIQAAQIPPNSCRSDDCSTISSAAVVACFRELKDEIAKNDDLALKNNELASKNNAVASENKELTTRVIELQEAFNATQNEMKDLQMQALDRLALIQSSVQALMTQTYELHEYPIPRLFIVLPQDISSWNPLDLLSNKFRLYFLCECGEHTKSTNSKIPHHIHLARHEGYDIARPNEFFQQYGSYALTLLKMLKYGIAVAGVVVPAVGFVVPAVSRSSDLVAERLKKLKDTIEPGLNKTIDYIEKKFADQGEAVVEQNGGDEALEGVDLRQLESFLKNKDKDRVLGNLYRTVTAEGHVKWVCIDHYRENYQGKVAKAFCDTVKSLGGSFDEIMGRAVVTLRSRVQAEQFYHILVNAKSVYELGITLDWNTAQADFKQLRDILSQTCVGVLELHVCGDGPISDIFYPGWRYNHIVDIM